MKKNKNIKDNTADCKCGFSAIIKQDGWNQCAYCGEVYERIVEVSPFVSVEVKPKKTNNIYRKSKPEKITRYGRIRERGLSGFLIAGTMILVMITVEASRR